LLIVVAIIGIIAAIAVPGLLRARMSGNEASAIGSMRAIGSAEASYSAAAGSGGYAALLATLATACAGGTQGFISPDLSVDPSTKSGYTVTLAAGAGAAAGPNDCNGTATTTAYYAEAEPSNFGSTGNRSFATSASGTIFGKSAATIAVADLVAANAIQ
jgi:type II secretory pathway pseudopilin PulG